MTPLRQAAQALRLAADAIEALEATADTRVDQFTAPMSRRAFLAAAKRKDFPTLRDGRKVFARMADVTAYLQRRKHPSKSGTVLAVDESTEDLLGSIGVPRRAS